MSRLHQHSPYPVSLNGASLFEIVVRRRRSVSSALWSILVLALVLAVDCEQAQDSVVDAAGVAPSLGEVSISPMVINTDSILVGPTRKPEDVLPLRVSVLARPTHPAGFQQIASVRYLVRKAGSGSALATGTLSDDGSGPDEVRGDGVYSGQATFAIKRTEVGTYFADVVAQGVNGFSSNTAILPLQVLRTNQPPALSNLLAPDTVKLASQDQLLVLQVSAADPNGLDDIQRVVFNSFRPDGGASSGNPFQMFDDGDTSHGDATRGDGIFSLRIILPSTTQTGTYRFEFQAFDKLNEGSNVIIHRVTVRQ